MRLGSASGLSGVSRAKLDNADEECNSNGQPIAHEGEPTYSDAVLQADHPDYALRHFYCVMAKNSGSPETVQGANSGTNQILCMFEKGAGFTFDGVARDNHLDNLIDNKELVAECGLDLGEKEEDNEAIRKATWTLTASSPAAFNTAFDSGVSVKGMIDGALMMEFSVASHVKNGVATILVRSGSDDEKKYDGYVASIDMNNQKLRFDARFDRFEANVGSSGKYSRRTQILAGLKVEGDDIVGIESIEGITSNAYDQEGGNFAEIQTIKGSLQDGLRTHNIALLQSSEVAADLLKPGNYAERADSKGAKATDECFADNEAADCAGNDGISLDGIASLDYLMIPGGKHTPVFTWVDSISELNFESLSLQE